MTFSQLHWKVWFRVQQQQQHLSNMLKCNCQSTSNANFTTTLPRCLLHCINFRLAQFVLALATLKAACKADIEGSTEGSIVVVGVGIIVGILESIVVGATVSKGISTGVEDYTGV
jgi:hypothetical protein